MAVVVSQEHMAPEVWSAVIDYTPEVYDLLWDKDAKKPRKLWAYIYDDAIAGDLVYPPLELFKVDGDEKGLFIGGLGILNALGTGDVGPTVVDREYVSGADKLSNGGFDLDGLYWRRNSEDSMWLFADGLATNAGGLRVDDVLEYDRKFPTRPGYQYTAAMEGVTGAGRLRLRTIYEGRFNPIDLLYDGGFELTDGWTETANITLVAGGQRTGTRSMRIGAIPKPQLLTYSNFPGFGWSYDDQLSVAGGVLTCAPIPYPQLLDDPGLEAGTEWMSPNSDIAIEATAEARTGAKAMRVGPITQYQLLKNPTLATNLDYWRMSSDIPAPEDPGLFYWHATDGLDNGPGATTAGVVTPAPLAITDQSEFESWMASHGSEFDATFQPNGTPYTTFEANSLGSPNRGASGYKQDFNGGWITTATAATPVALVVANRSEFWSWLASMPNGTSFATFEANSLADPNRGATGYIQDFDGGWVTGARSVRYLRADWDLGPGVLEHPVTPGEQYELEVYARRAASDGHAYASVAIPHPTIADRQRWYVTETAESDSLPDNTHKLLSKQVNIPPSRFELNILLEVHDHTTGYWTFSQPRMTRIRGNRAKAQVNHTIGVEPNSAYRLSARMRSFDEFQVGSVRLGTRLTGAGLDDDVTDVSQGHTDSEWTLVKVEFTPQDGYNGTVPFILGEDIIGNPMWVDDFRLEKISNNTRQTNHPAVDIVAGQRYQLASSVRSLAGQTRGEVRVGVVLSGAGMDDTDVAIDQSDTEGKVLRLAQDFTPDDGYTSAVPYVRFKDVEGAPFEVYGVTLTKMDNNTETSLGFGITVIPERTYRWLQAVRSGANLQRGSVKLSVVCSVPGNPGAPNVVFDSSAMEATTGEWRFIDFSFTPPSGYAYVSPRIIGIDVEGDVFNLDDGEIRDTDTTTHVTDNWLDSPTDDDVTMLTAAPEGAESVRVALVVEAGSSGWSVDAVSLVRSGVTPSTAADIVADTLIHPSTGAPLPIAAGTVTAPDIIPYDFLVQHQTNRQLLDHLCNVVADPPLEYRVLATDPPTIDVGPADVVCTTHPMADALLPEDRDVEELGNPTTDTSERPTEVTVLGAELATVSGQPFLITATAQVLGPVESDLNGNVVVRTKHHHDATVDHAGYAQALADDIAARYAEPALAVSVKLSGKDTRAAMPPGDTVYAYEPESGLYDPDNSVIIEGNTVFPRSCRVLARERVHGPSHRIVMRRPDGTSFPLPGVRWSNEDALTLTIGDRLPDWVADPQGHAAGVEYLRDRASRPR